MSANLQSLNVNIFELDPRRVAVEIVFLQSTESERSKKNPKNNPNTFNFKTNSVKVQ